MVAGGWADECDRSLCGKHLVQFKQRIENKEMGEMNKEKELVRQWRDTLRRVRGDGNIYFRNLFEMGLRFVFISDTVLAFAEAMKLTLPARNVSKFLLHKVVYFKSLLIDVQNFKVMYVVNLVLVFLWYVECVFNDYEVLLRLGVG